MNTLNSVSKKSGAKQIEQWATNGILDMVLYHSHSNKPIRRRVVIRQNHKRLERKSR